MAKAAVGQNKSFDTKPTLHAGLTLLSLLSLVSCHLSAASSIALAYAVFTEDGQTRLGVGGAVRAQGSAAGHGFRGRGEQKLEPLSSSSPCTPASCPSCPRMNQQHAEKRLRSDRQTRCTHSALCTPSSDCSPTWSSEPPPPPHPTPLHLPPNHPVALPPSCLRHSHLLFCRCNIPNNLSLSRARALPLSLHLLALDTLVDVTHKGV